MGKGLDHPTLPTPGQDFSPTDEAQFRRALEKFMTTADGRVREVDEDLDALEDRVATLEGASDTGLVLIEAQTAASVASVDFTTGIDGTYDEYLLSILNATPDADAIAQLRTSSDGGSTWDSGANDYTHAASEVDANAGVTDAGGIDPQIRLLGGSVGGGVDENGISLSVHIARPSVAEFTHIFWNGMAFDGSGILRAVYGGGMRRANAAVDGLRFLFSAGNVESGDFRLYGLVNS